MSTRTDNAGDAGGAGHGDSTARPWFTVFTPTRNRATLLQRNFDCLQAQTFRDFEWLVIDNDSSDDTAEVVARWQRQAAFPIRYVRREQNGGLQSSYAMAYGDARGFMFVALRDADTFAATALERFKALWESIDEAQREDFVGVTVNVVDEQGHLVGEPFPADVFDSDYCEIVYRHKARGEKWGCQRTAIVRAHAYALPPQYTGYVPESVMWRRIAQRYRTRYVNESLRTYWQNVAGRQSVNATPWHGAYGAVVDSCDALKLDLRWFGNAPLRLGWVAIRYCSQSFHLGRAPLAQWQRLRGAGAKALWLAALAPGFALYLREDLRRRALGEARVHDPEAATSVRAEAAALR